MTDVLAIVGSEHWPDGSEDRVKELIRAELCSQPPDLVISGGCAGVDRWAIEVALELDIPCNYRDYLPERPQWQPRGYKARNIKIARACTRMLAIKSASSRRGGTVWTATYTRNLDKPVDMHEL